jgi:serine/threonine-protein kinase
MPHPQRLGKYQIIAPLAKGGMGEVFLARQHGPSGFSKIVVIKTLPEDRRSSQRHMQMLMTEANIAGWLNHVNIAQVYDVGQTENSTYIVMEFVAGKSLHKIIQVAYQQQKPLHPAYIIHIFSQVCDGLAFAHEAKDAYGSQMQLIHRDINPNNILVAFSSAVKIIDFGIAKRLDTLSNNTNHGTIKGTIVYMSPEQALGQALSYRSDIFSLGICIYEALTGSNPFYRENIHKSLEAVRAGNYPPITSYNMNLQPFSPIITQAMAKDPNQRYESVKRLAQDLRGLLEDHIIAHAPISLEDYLKDVFKEDIDALGRLLERSYHKSFSSTTQAQAAEHMAKSVVKFATLNHVKAFTTGAFLCLGLRGDRIENNWRPAQNSINKQEQQVSLKENPYRQTERHLGIIALTSGNAEFINSELLHFHPIKSNQGVANIRITPQYDKRHFIVSMIYKKNRDSMNIQLYFPNQIFSRFADDKTWHVDLRKTIEPDKNYILCLYFKDTHRTMRIRIRYETH